MSGLNSHLHALLLFQQMHKYQELTRSKFIEMHQATDLDNMEAMLLDRAFTLPERLLTNLTTWADLPETDITFFTDVFDVKTKRDFYTKSSDSLETQLLSTDVMDDVVAQSSIGQIDPKFREAFRSPPIVLTEMLMSSAKITEILGSFYKRIVAAVGATINEDQVFLTPQMKEFAGIKGVGELFTPVAKPGILDGVLAPNLAGLFETAQSRNDGYMLNERDLRRLKNTLRTNILDPRSVRSVLEPHEVKYIVNTLAHEAAAEIQTLGYSSVKGLIPFKLGRGVNRPVLLGKEYVDSSDVEEAIVHSDDTKRRTREQVLALCRDVLPIDPIEFMLTLDESENTYHTYVDALCGGILFQRSSGESRDMVSGRSKPYGLDYATAWSLLTDESLEMQMTRNVFARPITRIPIPSGSFSYYQIGPGMGMLCSIPMRENAGQGLGQVQLFPVGPEYLITGPFTHMCLTRATTQARYDYDTYADELREFNLIRPWIWQVREKVSTIQPRFLKDGTWRGRRTTYGTPYFYLPFPLTGASSEAAKPTDKATEAGASASGQAGHAKLIETLNEETTEATAKDRAELAAAEAAAATTIPDASGEATTPTEEEGQ